VTNNSRRSWRTKCTRSADHVLQASSAHQTRRSAHEVIPGFLQIYRRAREPPAIWPILPPVSLT